jgi:hypothetical protein
VPLVKVISWKIAMSKVARFFKRRWKELLFPLAVLSVVYFFAHTSEAYRFSLQVIKQTGIFGDRMPVVFIKGGLIADYLPYDPDAKEQRLYAFNGDIKGTFLISVKKDLDGNWCAMYVSFNGEEINDILLPCRNRESYKRPSRPFR